MTIINSYFIKSVVIKLSIKNYNSFAVIGGDKRQLFAAKSIADDGFTVTLGGFDKLISIGNLEMASPIEAALCSEIIILPLPAVKEENKINAPFSNEVVYLDDGLVKAMQGKKIFCGMKEKLFTAAPKLNRNLVYDYFDREELAVLNAVPTAEGAVEIAMREFEGTISGSKCLVCGFGRIGKVLANILKGLGADVTISARKKSDIAWGQIYGYKAVSTDDLIKCKNCDIIFNTIPALVFDSILLAHIAMDSILIDLASAPGGVDFAAAKRLNIDVIQALSLPGKAAPKTAGEIIKNTIYNMLEEDLN